VSGAYSSSLLLPLRSLTLTVSFSSSFIFRPHSLVTQLLRARSERTQHRFIRHDIGLQPF
jgi:hypothetical protein